MRVTECVVDLVRVTECVVDLVRVSIVALFCYSAVENEQSMLLYCLQSHTCTKS